MSIDLTKQIASINAGDIIRLKITEDNADESSLDFINSNLEKPENIHFLEIDFPFAQVPDFLSACSSLYEVSLSGISQYQGIEKLAACRRLSIFDYYEQLDKLPDTLGKLSQLSYLYLSAPILSVLPRSLGSCKLLESLYLSDCNSLTTLPDTLGALNNLKTLEISNAPLGRMSPGILKLVNLQSLSMDGCELKEVPVGLKELKKLESISIDDNLIERKPEFLNAMEDLFYVSYEGNPFA